MEKHEGPTAPHGFTHTTIHHHHDGSHTVHHHHIQPEKHVHHAVPDLEGVHQSLHDHLGGTAEGVEGAMEAPVPAAAPAAPGLMVQ
jgi:hypothetical protein